MSDIQNVHIEKTQRWWHGRPSLVWLLPIAALGVALLVALQSYANQGRVIHVTFQDASGIVANSTELRFRDVSVGIVEDIGLSEDLNAVDVTIRLSKEISRYVDTAAQFWVVRPELTTQGVSGLETVLSGVYIEGNWDSQIAEARDQFEGRREVPLFRADKPGLQISLRSLPRGQLLSDGPIFFRGIEVGRIGKAYIDPRGNFAIAEAVIYEPHDRLVNEATRFWDTSGFSISLDTSGASIDFTSLASLVAGGITFETFVSGGNPAQDGMQFQVFSSEDKARNSIFNQSLVDELTVSVIFDDNIAGLSIGAPVELSGLPIGSVAGVTGIVDEETFGDSRVRLNALLSIQPGSLGLEGDISAQAALDFLQNASDDGLRAQLTTASLLTGGLKVQFIPVEDAQPASIQRTSDGVVVLPSTQSDVSDVDATVEGLIGRINALPVEALMVSAIDFLEAGRGLVNDEALRETPRELRNLLAQIAAVVNSEDVRAIPQSFSGILRQIETLLDELETEQAVTRIVAAIDAAAAAAARLDSSVEGVPALIDELTGVAATARSLPLDALVQRLTELVDTADELVGTEGMQQLPVQLNMALGQINATLQDLRDGGAITNVNETLSSARDAADAVAVSARDFPAVVERLNNVLSQASTTISGYDSGDTISRDAQAALRDIQQAADAITSLARTLERNPSALIRGR